MKKRLLFDLVKRLMEEKEARRDSDKKLMFAVWHFLGFVHNAHIDYSSFMNPHCPTPETITRVRRKIQQLYPELRATMLVEGKRKRIALEKGTHIYREEAIEA